MISMSTTFWGRIVQPMINAVKGDRTLAYLRDIESLPFLSPTDAKLYQIERMKCLIRHCYENVPFYRSTLDERSLTPADFRSLEDLQLLPVLTRKLVVENHDQFIARNVPLQNLFPKSTGGSTGTPLNLFYDRSYWYRGEAGLLRMYRMAGYEIGEPIFILWAFPENLMRVPLWQQRLRQALRRKTYLDTGKYGHAQLGQWADMCRKIRPTIIYGYASALYDFARYLLDENISISHVKGVFPTSERLYPFQRRTMGEAFRCKVLDSYGCAEVLHLAFECPHGNLHQTSDFSIVETERNGTDHPLHFLVTSLWNQAFPLLRYRNNDMGGVRDAACSCGRGFPLLDLEISRIIENFITHSGMVIHGTSLMHLLYGIRGIERYQLYQRHIDEICMYIVKARDYSADTLDSLEHARREITAMMDEKADVSLQFVDEIPRTRAGKFLYIRSDAHREHARED